MSRTPRLFHKYHGTGNDFVIIEWTGDPDAVGYLAPFLCDRHRGVGADGVIVVDTEAAPPRMTIFNADGSRPQMCGNGLRCVARHLFDLCGAPAQHAVQTDAGLRACSVDGQLVDVEMGPARLDGEVTWSLAGCTWKFQSVNMGNPHAVVFVAEGDPPREQRAAIGAALNGPDATFPEGVNVEFATVLPDNRVVVEVYERGVGFTQACGTGACAVTAAAWQAGLVPPDDAVKVVLPGGTLSIRETDGSLWLRGDTERVMDATLDDSWMTRRSPW